MKPINLSLNEAQFAIANDSLQLDIETRGMRIPRYFKTDRRRKPLDIIPNYCEWENFFLSTHPPPLFSLAFCSAAALAYSLEQQDTSFKGKFLRRHKLFDSNMKIYAKLDPRETESEKF